MHVNEQLMLKHLKQLFTYPTSLGFCATAADGQMLKGPTWPRGLTVGKNIDGDKNWAGFFATTIGGDHGQNVTVRVSEEESLPLESKISF